MNKIKLYELNRQADAFSHSHLSAAIDMVERIKPFGLTYFLYNRLVDDDKYMAISVENQWFRELFGYSHDREIFDTQMATLEAKEEKELKDKYSLWQFSFSNNPLMEALRQIDINHGITLYRDHDSYKESFHFATTNENHQILEFYLNNLTMLDSIADEFAGKMEKALDHETNALYVHVEKSTSSQLAKKPSLLINNRQIQLTLIQHSCFELLKRGYSDKQIAQKLGKSHRTIERHVSNILCQLGLISRKDILDMKNTGMQSPNYKCLND